MMCSMNSLPQRRVESSRAIAGKISERVIDHRGDHEMKSKTRVGGETGEGSFLDDLEGSPQL